MLCRTRSQLFLGCVIFATGCLFYTNDAAAQSSSKSSYTQSLLRRQNRGTTSSFFGTDRIKARNSRSLVPRVGVPGLNQRSFSNSLSSGPIQRTKPFTGVTHGPTVSPYLALSRPFGSATDYQAIVRPLREQQRQQQRQQVANIQNQRRLNQMAVQAPFNIQGDENAAPTGHSAVFMKFGNYQDTGGYFPPPSAPKQR